MINANAPAPPASPTEPDHGRFVWLNVQQVAVELAVPVKTVYRWRKLGGGPPAHKFGKHWRFRQDLLDIWMDQQLSEDPPEAS